MTFVKANKTKKGGTHDDVETPYIIAQNIIKNLPIANGELCLDPSRGSGNFYNNFPIDCIKDYCEIKENKCFFDYNKKVDWIITNPPYSIFDSFIEHAFEISNNVVFLCPLCKFFSSMGRIRKYLKYGGIIKIMILSASKCGFNFGFPCAAIWFKKDYKGQTQIIELE